MPIDPRTLPTSTQLGLKMIAQWMARRKAMAQTQRLWSSGASGTIPNAPERPSPVPPIPGRPSPASIPPRVARQVLAVLAQRSGQGH